MNEHKEDADIENADWRSGYRNASDIDRLNSVVFPGPAAGTETAYEQDDLDTTFDSLLSARLNGGANILVQNEGKIADIRVCEMPLPRPPKGHAPSSKRMHRGIGFSASGMHFERPDWYARMAAHAIACQPQHERNRFVYEVAGQQRWLNRGGRICYPDFDVVNSAARSKLRGVRGLDILTTYPSIMFNFPIGIPGLPTHTLVNMFDVDEGGLTVRITKPKPGGPAPYTQPHPRHPREHRVIIIENWHEDTELDTYLCFALDAGEIDSMSPNSQLNTIWHMDAAEAAAHQGKRDFDMAINLLLIMQSSPDYIVGTEAKQRKFGKKKGTESSSHIRLVRPTRLVQQVPYDPTGLSTVKGAGTVTPHWRGGFWRRQRHAIAWEIDNPDVAVITMPDAGRAHMVHIEPLWVDGGRSVSP
tara:strand:- start:363 stop:1610 length:1248 start_codon:yes stop_codon:yes gene_type:complete